MPATLKEVLKTNTFEQQRQIINSLALEAYEFFSGSEPVTNQNILLQDGTVGQPSLAFTNEATLGLYRAGNYKLGFAVGNQLVAAFGLDTYTQGDPINPEFLLYKSLASYVASGIGNYTLTDNGINYTSNVDIPTATNIDSLGIVTSYTDVNLTSITGNGSGGVATIEVTALGGSIQDPGKDYIPGSYANIDLINVSRISASATGEIQNSGINYIAGTYSNVPLINGSGQGLRANVTTGGVPVQVTSVTIIDSGTGYSQGDLLSVDPVSLGGSGSGFIYVLTSYVSPGSNGKANISIGGLSGSVTNIGSGYVNGLYENVPLTQGSGTGAAATINVAEGVITSVSITNSGSGYLEGEVLSALNTDLGGSGSGFQYTISEFGRVINVSITDPGENYLKTDVLSLDLAGIGGFSGLITNGGSGYVNGTYENVPLTQGNGTGIVANITISGQDLISGTISNSGSNYPTGTYTNIPVLNIPKTTYSVTLLDVNPGPPSAVFEIDGISNPQLSLERGNTYKFDLSDPSVEAQVFSIREAGGGALPSGVVFFTKGTLGTPGAEAYLIINESVEISVVLEYFSPSEDGWGNTIQITTGASGNFGRNALASVEVDGSNVVSSFQITNNGTGYAVGDTLTLYSPDLSVGSSGSGFVYTISSISPNGSITNVEVTDVGANYDDGDVLSALSSNLGGSGSGFTYTLSNYNKGADFEYLINAVGSITDIELTSKGINYNIGDRLSIGTEPFSAFGSNFELTVGSIEGYQSNLLTPEGRFSTNKISVGYPVESVLFEDNSEDVVDFIVNGKSAFRSTIELPTGSFTSPSLKFENIPTLGFFASTSNDINYFNFKTNFGTILSLSDKLELYKDASFVLQSIDESSITGGSQYNVGVYQNVELSGGSGSDNIADVYIAFSGTISSPGSEYHPEIGETLYSDVSITGGSGSGASADVLVVDGVITQISVTNNGSGYQVGDIVSVNSSQMVDEVGDGGTGSGAQYTIQSLGAVTKVDFTDPGNGYAVGDILTFDDSFTSVGNGSGFFLEVTSVNKSEKAKLTLSDGSLTVNSLKTSSAGINVANRISIGETRISKLQLGNLELSGSSTGFVKIVGTGALLIPAGTTDERPSNAIAGAIRYNTDESRFEGFSGDFFVSLGGVRDVDGNTYITAELNAGDDDNTIRFVNDGIQSLQVEKTSITLQSITNAAVTNVSDIQLWVEGDSVTAPVDPINDPPVYVYFGENVYSVDTTGTFDADPLNFPTHTSGTATNGTVDLTFVRNIYGDLNYTGNSLNLDLNSSFSINGSVLKLSGDTSTSLIQSESTDLKLTLSSSNYPLIKINDTGSLEINNNFGTSENYIKILDYELDSFTLRDTKIFTADSSIDTSLGNAVNVPISIYDSLSSTLESYSGKVMIEILDDSPSPRRQYSELSFLVKSDLSDVLYTENNKIYTDVDLCDISIGIDGSNNITVDVVDLTGSSTTVYTIKIVSNLILV